MVVAEFGREIVNSFEGGDMAAVLADIKNRLETFASVSFNLSLPVYAYLKKIKFFPIREYGRHCISTLQGYIISPPISRLFYPLSGCTL
jgi:hypothetical protein